MSLNWVMLPNPPNSNAPFIALPNERIVFKSSHRTSLSLTTPKSTYPAHAPQITITSSDGTLFLTNQRVIYIPRANSTTSCNVASDLKSFSCPLLNLHDTHLVMPWFGPNAWTALVQPVAGGGLPPATGGLELKFTFKEGGAPDFQGKFEAIKERLREVVDVARATNQSTGPTPIVDMSRVHLDELPRYEDSGHDRIAPDREPERAEATVPNNATAEQVRAMAATAATQRQEESIRRQSREEEMARETPSDAPPGYEEAQNRVVADALEERLEREERNAWQEESERRS